MKATRLNRRPETGQNASPVHSWEALRSRALEPLASHVLRLAIRSYRRLEFDDQLLLAEEIADSRKRELLLAYPDAVAVSAGMAVARTANASRRRFRATPAVLFVVRRKRRGRRLGDRAIPRHLFAYRTIGGERLLCAVPTDVDELSDYARVRAHGPPQVHVTSSGGGEVEGVLACAVQRDPDKDEASLISCRHVLGATRLLYPASPTGLSVRLADGTTLASTSSTRGTLRPGPNTSFDAQLTEAVSLDRARHALGGISIEGAALTPDELPVGDVAWVVTPRGPIKIRIRERSFLKPPIGYGTRDLADVVHDELIASQCEGPLVTEPGDSGSPVLSRRDGGRLLGMHIAGDPPPKKEAGDPQPKKTWCYAIPAWQLLSPRGYLYASNAETWRLVSPAAPKGLAEPAMMAAASADASHFAPHDATHAAPPDAWRPDFAALRQWHQFGQSVRWRLTPVGAEIEGSGVETTSGPPQTVGRVWTAFSAEIQAAAQRYSVPIELIVATICTESSGNPDVVYLEPGYVSDAKTPARISVGLMQTLIATAREALGDPTLDRTALLQPAVSIRAGTSYIARNRTTTGFDPPLVACAYNAGGLYTNSGHANRWKMRQYPLGSSAHADRFIRWFNDCMRFFRSLPSPPLPSFCHAIV